MSHDFSIDLETLSNKYNSPILSIGVCKFDRLTGKTGPTFYVEIDPEDALRYGKPTASTLSWWMEQSYAARRVFKPSPKKVTLTLGLRMLGDFLRSQGKGTPTVWGNGSSFDITILEHAYDVAGGGLEPQWHFWNIRDMRTLIDVAEMSGFKKRQLTKGTAHNALDDAVHQAEVMAEAFAHVLGGKKPVATPSPAPAEDDDEL